MTRRESCKLVNIAAAGPIPGLVLAGGLSRRMGGGDKGLRLLGDKPLISHVIERLGAQASPLAINANGDPARFSAFGLPIVADADEDFAGPLAGVLAGLRWAANAVPDARFLATVACDTPFFPAGLVSRLLEAIEGCEPPVVAVAQSSSRMHPVFGLWPLSLTDELAAVLASGERKVTAFVERRPHVAVEFPPVSKDGSSFDPFFNANTPREFAQAEALLTRKIL